MWQCDGEQRDGEGRRKLCPEPARYRTIQARLLGADGGRPWRYCSRCLLYAIDENEKIRPNSWLVEPIAM